MDLSLSNGAGIRIETGRWIQTDGGTVSEGANGSDGIFVTGELYKTGSGEFVI